MSELRQRQPRLVDPGYLAFLHTKRCCICGFPTIEAAHIRMANLELGKRETGKQEKPDDKWAVPLCSWCHREAPDSQHNSNEAEFWARFELDPFAIAQALYAEYGGDGGKPQRRRSTTKPRPPKSARRPIQQRKTPWPSKKFRSRPTP